MANIPSDGGLSGWFEDVQLRERHAKLIGAAYPVSFYYQSQLGLVHPTVSVGFPASLSRGVLDYLSQDNWSVAKIGTSSWRVLFDFPSDVDETERQERISRAKEEEMPPEGAIPVALQLTVGLVAARDDGNPQGFRCEHSDLVLEFLVRIDLPVLGQIVTANFLGLTTPEASSDHHNLSVLCDVPGGELYEILRVAGLWNPSLMDRTG